MELPELWRPEINTGCAVELFQSSGGLRSMLFSIEVLIEVSCRASRVLQVRNEYRMRCGASRALVEHLELWRSEINAFLNTILNRLVNTYSNATTQLTRFFPRECKGFGSNAEPHYECRCADQGLRISSNANASAGMQTPNSNVEIQCA